MAICIGAADEVGEQFPPGNSIGFISINGRLRHCCLFALKSEETFNAQVEVVAVFGAIFVAAVVILAVTLYVR